MIFGALKVRQPGFLAREVRAVRDKTGFANELKFSGITRRSLPVYYELIGALHRSDAHIVGTVVDGSVHDPFRGRREDWKVHAEVISQLVYGCVNKRELVSVMMDAVSTPPECSIEEVVRTRTNRKLGTTGVISALVPRLQEQRPPPARRHGGGRDHASAPACRRRSRKDQLRQDEGRRVPRRRVQPARTDRRPRRPREHRHIPTFTCQAQRLVPGGYWLETHRVASS